jgi:hypothetical protein
MLDQLRAGITPENNAAAILWPVVRPSRLDPADYQAIAMELGPSSVPSQSEALVLIEEPVTEWLKSKQRTGNDPDPTVYFSDIESLTDRAASRPWTDAELPWLAKWVRQNERPLDQMVAASQRPRCYFPIPTLLNTRSDPLVAMGQSWLYSMQDAADSLAARAMRNVGEHRLRLAWQDLLAAHRLARLMTQGPTLFDQITGTAIAEKASLGTLAFLHEGQPSVDEARRILRDLSALESFNGYANALDYAERLTCLDSMVRISRGNLDDDTLEHMKFGPQVNHLSWFRNDWNPTLRKCNEIYDRTVAASRLPTYIEREATFSQLFADVDRTAGRSQGDLLIAAVLSPSARNQLATALMVALYYQGVEGIWYAQEQANFRLDLDRIAAALAVYRAEHGAYPEKLSDLVPSVLEKLPTDSIHVKPLLYKQIGEGYLLYAVGPNGQDDGGSNSRSYVLEGQSCHDFDENIDIRNDADDIAIRVPRTPTKALIFEAIRVTP